FFTKKFFPSLLIQKNSISSLFLYFFQYFILFLHFGKCIALFCSDFFFLQIIFQLSLADLTLIKFLIVRIYTFFRCLYPLLLFNKIFLFFKRQLSCQLLRIMIIIIIFQS